MNEPSSVKSVSMPDSAWNLIYQFSEQHGIKMSQAVTLLVRHGAIRLKTMEAGRIKVDYSKLAPLQEELR